MSECRPVKVTSSMFTDHAKCSTMKQDKGEATRGFEPWENHIIMDERVLRALTKLLSWYSVCSDWDKRDV